jgi:hypothetical protein
MTRKPIAIGSDTDPILAPSSTSATPGHARPSSRPAAIAARIQTGSSRSSVESRASAAGSACVVMCHPIEVRRWEG